MFLQPTDAVLLFPLTSSSLLQCTTIISLSSLDSTQPRLSAGNLTSAFSTLHNIATMYRGTIQLEHSACLGNILLIGWNTPFQIDDLGENIISIRNISNILKAMVHKRSLLECNQHCFRIRVFS